MKKLVPAESASALIDEMIAELTDWRGKTLASARESILAADREIIEEWKWMGSPVWSRDGIIAVGNAHKDKSSLPFPRERGSQILSSCSTRASEATPGERSIFSRATRLTGVP